MGDVDNPTQRPDRRELPPDGRPLIVDGLYPGHECADFDLRSMAEESHYSEVYLQTDSGNIYVVFKSRIGNYRRHHPLFPVLTEPGPEESTLAILSLRENAGAGLGAMGKLIRNAELGEVRLGQGLRAGGVRTTPVTRIIAVEGRLLLDDQVQRSRDGRTNVGLSFRQTLGVEPHPWQVT